MNESIIRKAEDLRQDLIVIYNIVAEEMGMNIDYCKSMNGSLFPTVVDIILGEAEDYKKESIVQDDYQFLASNGFILPETLKDATYETIKNYVFDNADTILDTIREWAESDYKDVTGEEYGNICTDR